MDLCEPPLLLSGMLARPLQHYRQARAEVSFVKRLDLLSLQSGVDIDLFDRVPQLGVGGRHQLAEWGPVNRIREWPSRLVQGYSCQFVL